MSDSNILLANNARIATDEQTRSGKQVHFQQVQIDGLVAVSLSANGGDDSYDAFGRLRMSNPFTAFDSKLISDAQSLVWDDAEKSGAGTSSAHNTNQASVTIGVSAATTGVRTRQTKRRFLYQPGKSQLIYQTGVIGAAASGIKRRIGIFDDDNGLFFESDENGIGVVVRTYTSGAAVEARVEQADWNIDPLDGTGSSEVTLDVTKTQIFVIDFEWLGVGSVRFGFVIDGRLHYVHKVKNANVLSLVYMGNPNLPLRYEIANDGTGGASSLLCICSTVITEGGRQYNGRARSVHRTAALAAAANGVRYPLIAMRLADLKGVVQPLGANVLSASTDPFLVEVLLNPTITGEAFAFGAVSNSPVEVDVARTVAATLSDPGTVIQAALFTGGNVNDWHFDEDAQIGHKIDGTSDIIVLSVQRLSGTGSDSVWASLNWQEVI